MDFFELIRNFGGSELLLGHFQSFADAVKKINIDIDICKDRHQVPITDQQIESWGSMLVKLPKIDMSDTIFHHVYDFSYSYKRTVNYRYFIIGKSFTRFVDIEKLNNFGEEHNLARMAESKNSLTGMPIVHISSGKRFSIYGRNSDGFIINSLDNPSEKGLILQSHLWNYFNVMN